MDAPNVEFLQHSLSGWTIRGHSCFVFWVWQCFEKIDKSKTNIDNNHSHPNVWNFKHSFLYLVHTIIFVGGIIPGFTPSNRRPPPWYTTTTKAFRDPRFNGNPVTDHSSDQLCNQILLKKQVHKINKKVHTSHFNAPISL